MLELIQENIVNILIFLGGVVSVLVSIINYKRTGKFTNVSSVKDALQLEKVAKLSKKDWTKLFEYHTRYMTLWAKVLEKTPDNTTAREMYEYHKSICNEISKKNDGANNEEVK